MVFNLKTSRCLWQEPFHDTFWNSCTNLGAVTGRTADVWVTHSGDRRDGLKAQIKEVKPRMGEIDKWYRMLLAVYI